MRAGGSLYTIKLKSACREQDLSLSGLDPVPRSKIGTLLLASEMPVPIPRSSTVHNLLGDNMRLHLQPRLDMTSDTSSLPTYLHALLLSATTFTWICRCWVPLDVSARKADLLGERSKITSVDSGGVQS